MESVFPLYISKAKKPFIWYILYVYSRVSSWYILTAFYSIKVFMRKKENEQKSKNENQEKKREYKKA